MQASAGMDRLKKMQLKEIVSEKRRLVEVPYTATLAHTINALVANRVVAVPVAAPPGHWIGAGGSMILESDKQTGAVRKHYIGMVTMLDILAHIAGDDVGGAGDAADFEQKMSVPVSSVIGHCVESLSLWTLSPTTSLLDCMEVLSKGVHRALVPLDSKLENVPGAELEESASCYRMVTQMDVVRFLKAHEAELGNVMACTILELGACSDTVFGVTDRTKVIDAIKSMRAASITALPIVKSSVEDQSALVDGKGRKLVGTFSATDLRGCPVSQLRHSLSAGVLEFTESPTLAASANLTSLPRELVTCYLESSLSSVVNNVVKKHTHRVWVVDHMGHLTGVVSLSDIIRVVRASLMSE